MWASLFDSKSREILILYSSQQITVLYTNEENVPRNIFSVSC